MVVQYFLIVIFAVNEICSSASFDCGSPSLQPDELTICENKELSDLDSILSELYSKVLRNLNNDERGHLKETQRMWLADRYGKCGQDSECIHEHYSSRIKELEKLIPDVEYKFEIGLWERIPFQGFETGELKITSIDTNGFQFEIHATSGGHAGYVEGKAQLITPVKANFFGTEYPCTLSFTWSNKVIVVKQKVCHCCGVGVTVGGKYSRDTLNKSHSFDEFKHLSGLINDERVNKATYNLLGKDNYSTFANSFHLVYDETDIDSMDCKVIRGGLRGAFTIAEAILMFNSSPQIYAAYISKDTVKYYTTDTAYKHILPLTIENWKKRFETYSVINGNDGLPVKTKMQIAQEDAYKKQQIIKYATYVVGFIVGLLILYFLALGIIMLTRRGIEYLKPRIFLPQILCTAILIFALNPDNPYGYYIFLRFACCSAFVYLAYKTLLIEKNKWAFVLVISALIYNPLIPFHLTREIWTVLNVITIVILLPTIHILRMKKDTTKAQNESCDANVNNT